MKARTPLDIAVNDWVHCKCTRSHERVRIETNEQ